MRIKLIAFILLTYNYAVSAIPLEKQVPLKTHLEFGFINTSGNTDTTAYNLELHMKKAWNRHLVEYSFDGQYADYSDYETKNKFLTELEYYYALTDRFSFNYLVGCKNDKFSGYNYQVYTGPGTKYKLIKEEFYKLILKGNILYSQDEIEDIHRTADGSVINYPNKDNLIANPNQTIQGKVKSYAAFRAKAMYEWKILDNLKFTQDLSYRTKIDSTDNYFVYSKTTILSKISDIFSLGINYKIDYVNAPPEGKKRSDKTTSINLVVNY